MPRSRKTGTAFVAMVPAGTASLVSELIDRAVSDLVVEVIDDSMVQIRSSRPSLHEAAQAFTSNAFHVICTAPRRSLDASIAVLTEALFDNSEALALSAKSGFRIMAHIDGTLQGVSSRSRTALEQAITAVSGAKVQSRGGRDEVWIIGRRDHDRLLLTQRLPSSGAAPAKGALSPQIATIVSALADIRRSDIVLDPFAGSGAIALACAKAGPRQVMANDLALQKDAVRRTARYRSIVWSGHDVRQLADRHAHEVDVIVTDPPWGEFDQGSGSIDVQFATFAESFDVLLKPEGARCVLLMTRKHADTFAKMLTGHNLKVARRLPILVNGHPATILVAHR